MKITFTRSLLSAEQAIVVTFRASSCYANQSLLSQIPSAVHGQLLAPQTVKSCPEHLESPSFCPSGSGKDKI